VRPVQRAVLVVLAAVVAAGVVAVGALCLVGGLRTSGRLPTGDAVPRSPSPTARYGAIAGSDSWLLYAQTTRDDKVPVVASDLPYPRNPRYLLDGAGRRLAVPQEAAVSLLGDEPLLLQLARPPRFRTSAALGNGTDRPIGLRWKLASSGAAGPAQLPPHSVVTAFGPADSWVTATTVGRGGEDTQFAPVDRLTQYFPSGRRVDLGVPFPQGAPYALTVSGSGLVAYSSAGDGGDYAPTGQIRFHPWSTGTWRTLNPGDPPQGEIDCSPASERFLDCRLAGPGDEGYRTLRLGLQDGSRRVVTVPRAFPAGCARAQAATETGFLGIVSDTEVAGRSCPAGALSRISLDGSVTLSTRVYDRFHAPVIAFGHIVVDEYREHRLLALGGIDDTPQVVVGR
jgi:hypothetical protein